MRNRNLINEMVDSGPELLMPGKSILDWFDPKSTDHLAAYKVLQESGQWPRGFIPEGLEFPENWNASLAQRVARHFTGAADTGTKDTATVASESIEPAETDPEDIKIKKLTEQVSEEDYKKQALLGKKNEAEDDEVPPENPEEAPGEEPPEPEEEEPEEVELEKAYLGRSADKHLYIIANKGDTGAVEDLLIVDQEGETVMSAKDEGLEVTDVPGFIEHAIQDTAKVKLEYVERGIVLKYVLPKAEEELGIEEPEEEEEGDEFGAEEEMPPEVPEEEPKKPKEEKPKESKTNEAKDEISRKEHLLKKKANLEKQIADIEKKVKEVESDLKRLGSTNEARMGVDYVRTMKTAVKTATQALKDKDYEAASKALEDVADDAADAAKAAKKMKREVDSKAETEKKDAGGAKECVREEIKDIKGNTFYANLVDSGTPDLIIRVNEREFKLGSEVASIWNIQESSLKEIVLDILEAMDAKEYTELLGKAEECTEEGEEPEMTPEKCEKCEAIEGQGLSTEAMTELKNLMFQKEKKEHPDFEDPQVWTIVRDHLVEMGILEPGDELEDTSKGDEESSLETPEDASATEEKPTEECAAKESTGVDEKKKPSVCPKCKKAHWPFQKCSAKGPAVKADSKLKAAESIEPAETDPEDIKIKKLTEQGEGELKDIYDVLYTTKDGVAKRTRIMAFSVDDAKKQLLRNASVKSVSSVNKIGEMIGDNKKAIVKRAVKANPSIKLGKGTKESIKESQEIDPAVLKAQELLGILPESKVEDQPIKEGDVVQIVRGDTFECLLEEAVVKVVDEKKGIEITGETIPENQKWFDTKQHIIIQL